jgi:hypothetical protein
MAYANGLVGNETRVLLREYKYRPEQTAVEWCRTVKDIVEEYLEEFRLEHKRIVWVLVGFEEEIPDNSVLRLMG